MESKNKIFTETIGTSSIAKTMRNSLVPTESTKRNIEKNGIIIDDQLRAEKRQQLKEIMDEYYRAYIDSKLSNVALTRTIDWKELFQAIENNYKQNTTKTKNELEKKQKEKRAEIYKILSDDEEFKQFSALFDAILVAVDLRSDDSISFYFYSIYPETDLILAYCKSNKMVIYASTVLSDNAEELRMEHLGINGDGYIYCKRIKQYWFYCELYIPT